MFSEVEIEHEEALDRQPLATGTRCAAASFSTSFKVKQFVLVPTWMDDVVM